MAARKHITEIALSFFSAGLLLLHPKDIKKIDQGQENVKKLAADCHIYFIVRHPRISFVPESILIGKNNLAGLLQYFKHGQKRVFGFELTVKLNDKEVEISEYPHSKLFFIYDGVKYSTIPAHILCMQCDHVEDESVRDLEVVYVGMSYAAGTRSAKDRLLDHSTLQQVLADINQDSPDEEALIVMAQYASPQTLFTIDPRDKTLSNENDRDLASDFMKQKALITKDVEISLIEAGLIKYFQPFYNEKYKNRFPNPSQKILKDVYEIDFGALIVELNTESINGRFYSKTVDPGYHHIANYDFHDPQIRISFFNLMNLDRGFDAPDLSGPIF